MQIIRNTLSNLAIVNVHIGAAGISLAFVNFSFGQTLDRYILNTRMYYSM